jgi:hypothetical protein
MSSRPLQDILREDSALAQLQGRMAQLAPMQKVWRQAVPHPLVDYAEITGIEGDALLVRARGGAVAAKLKQMVPSLTRILSESFPDIKTLKIQVATPESPPIVRHRPGQGLSPTGLGYFKELCDTLPPSPLKKAIERLIKERQR